MNTHICPYLGSRDDPQTALEFPSEGNYCYHARPVSAIKTGHQSSYCLTGQHVNCPVFATRTRKPLPAAIAAPANSSQRLKRVLAFTFIPVALVMMAFLGNWLQDMVVAGQFRSQSGTSAEVPPIFLVPNSGLFSSNSLVTNTPLMPVIMPGTQQTPTPNPLLVKDCPLPVGWSSYIVKPSDSLFRLSVLYGVSIESLQQANCLSERAVIQPGSTIYIPVPPTPTITNTLVPTLSPVISPTQTTFVPNLQQPPQLLPTLTPTATQSAQIILQPTPILPTVTPTNTQLPPPLATPTVAQIFPTLAPPRTATPTNTTAPIQPTPTLANTPLPTNTLAPTLQPTPLPTNTLAPTPEPTLAPTNTLAPTPEPTLAPTNTLAPTPEPTLAPTNTLAPTPEPTLAPTNGFPFFPTSAQ
jgi:LysM repeat protein